MPLEISDRNNYLEGINSEPLGPIQKTFPGASPVFTRLQFADHCCKWKLPAKYAKVVVLHLQ